MTIDEYRDPPKTLNWRKRRAVPRSLASAKESCMLYRQVNLICVSCHLCFANRREFSAKIPEYLVRFDGSQRNDERNDGHGKCGVSRVENIDGISALTIVAITPRQRI